MGRTEDGKEGREKAFSAFERDGSYRPENFSRTNAVQSRQHTGPSTSLRSSPGQPHSFDVMIVCSRSRSIEVVGVMIVIEQDFKEPRWVATE